MMGGHKDNPLFYRAFNFDLIRTMQKPCKKHLKNLTLITLMSRAVHLLHKSIPNGPLCSICIAIKMILGTNARAYAMVFWQIESTFMATVQAMSNTQTREQFVASLRGLDILRLEAAYHLFKRVILSGHKKINP